MMTSKAKFILSSPVHFLAFGFGAGLSPRVPGTIGTLVSLPFVFLLKYISSMTDVKILLTGDGLDELCGYSEFYNLDETQKKKPD